MSLMAKTKEEKRRQRRSEEAQRDSVPTGSPQPASPAFTTFLLSLGCSLLGGLLLWAAFPPLNLWPIAWLAPLPWLYLILRPQPMTRGAYVGIGAGGLIHWLAMLYGIAMAHLALIAGWIVLSAYLAVYLPLFVGLCRIGVQRLRISVVFVAPIVWVGLEL